MANATTVTKLSAARLRKLVDDRALAKLALDAAKEKLEALDEQLKALGAGEYLGKQYKATVVFCSGSSLSVSKAKSFLTPAQILECSTGFSYVKVVSKEVKNASAS